MPVFPYERFRDFQGWIPESDAEGIDIDTAIVSDCENVEFENAFIRNLSVPFYVQFPAIVENYIKDEGYDLLSAKDFVHTVRGKSRFFLLYKEENGHQLKFVVEDETDAYELNPDEQNDNITFAKKPTDISYNLVDDQLKINLNIQVTYESIKNWLDEEKKLVANFTLCYLEETMYLTNAVSDTGYTRSESWYLFPRWLGWATEPSFDYGGTPTTLDESFTNSTPDNSEIDLANCESGYSYDDKKVCYGATGNKRIISITGLSSPRTLKITTANLLLSDPAEVTVSAGTYNETKLIGYITSPETYFHLSQVGAGMTVTVTVEASEPDIFIDQLNVYMLVEDEDFCLIAKNFDGQRALLNLENISTLSSYDNELKLDKNEIDWRIKSYELYFRMNPDSNVFVLVTEWVIDETLWTEWDTQLTDTKEVDYTSDSLNFNYGLGATVKVYSKDIVDEDVIGNEIFDEVFFKGRSYYTNFTEKVFQSHISGTGRPQPDSFPYNEDISFGYFVPADNDKIIGLALTSLDELMIGTNKRNVIYFIQSSEGTPLRTRKYVNGSYGIVSAKSLTKDVDGYVTSEVLFWADSFGLYIYGGGINAPKRITTQKLENYYNDISLEDKENSIAFYHRPKNEFWIQLGNDIIVYNLSYDEFKKHKFPYKIKEFVGEESNLPVVLTDDNRIVKLDPQGTAKFEGSFTLHYHTSKDVNEAGRPFSVSALQDKILQDLYVSLHKTASPGFIKVQIIIDDDIEIGEEIFFKGDETRDSIPSPLLVRYGKIKFRVTLSGDIYLGEFGYGWTLPDHPYILGKPKAVIGLGMETGGEHGVVY